MPYSIKHSSIGYLHFWIWLNGLLSSANQTDFFEFDFLETFARRVRTVCCVIRGS